MRPAITLCLILAMLFANGQPVSAQSAGGDAESGRLYSINVCTGCHSVDPETDGIGNFAPDFTAIAKQRSTTRGSLQAFLRSDHDRMPNFNLRPTEINDIVAYILTLRRR
jgi:cytochrome c